MFRRSKSKKKDARLPSGPVRLPLYCREKKSGLFSANGFRALKTESVSVNWSWP